jgi:hypothetical protein
MMLREIRSATFVIIQYDAIDIEGNITSSLKLKPRVDQTDKYKKKQK